MNSYFQNVDDTINAVSLSNLKMHLGNKHQNFATVTSKMSILKRAYFSTFYSLFYMINQIGITFYVK